MRTRFIRTPMPRLLIPQDEPEIGIVEKPRQAPLAKLAGIFDLEAEYVGAGPGAERWFHAVGHLPVDPSYGFQKPRYQVDSAWQAKAAAFCDLAVFLGGFAGAAEKAAADCREAARRAARPAPMVFHGPYTPDAARGVSGPLFDGLVVQEADETEDPTLAAEKLRRAASCLPTELLLAERGWQTAPAICLMGRLEVLVQVPPASVEYVLLRGIEPVRTRRPGGTLLVSLDREERPWWSEWLTFGPECVSWRPWARDPRVIL